MFKDLIKGKKGVIFDLDGTLVDTQKLWEEAMNEVFGNVTGIEGPPLEIGKGQFIEERWKNIIEMYDLNIGIPPQELTNQTYTKFIDLLNKSDLQVKSGFWRLIREFKEEKGFVVAIATNTTKDIAQQVLSHFNLDKVFEIIVYGDEVQNKKPAPDIYIETAKRMGLKPKEILVFEDSPTGAAAAKKAGMDLVIIWTSEHMEAEFPNDIKGINTDFTGIAGYLDEDYATVFKGYLKSIKQLFPQTEK